MSLIHDDPLVPTPTDRTSATDDQRIENIVPLPPPAHLIQFFPIKDTPSEQFIADTRGKVRDILAGTSDRLLVVIGPCSIHDPVSALDYAARLRAERDRLGADLEIVMRVYFEKPRTTVGWKGLINDPYLNGSFRIKEGLRIARDLLVRINQLGVPAGCEFLDVISPQYIGDLVSWGAIGARTTESQVHRELASGLSSAVGFKNGTDGNVRIAVAAILAARQRHHFLSVHKSGQVAIVDTLGNSDCHIILRGGTRPNYEAASVAAACAELAKAGLPQRLMIDLSHGNTPGGFKNQLVAGAEVADEIAGGDARIVGVAAESHLVEGRQDLKPGQPPVYGQSITDACIGWDDSLLLLDRLAQAVRARRALSGEQGPSGRRGGPSARAEGPGRRRADEGLRVKDGLRVLQSRISALWMLDCRTPQASRAGSRPSHWSPAGVMTTSPTCCSSKTLGPTRRPPGALVY